jgi:TolB-like protein
MMAVWRLALYGIAVLAGAAGTLRAQYPYVPPPVPCEPANGHWGGADADRASAAAPRRVAVVPFTSNFAAEDSANAGIVAAFSRRLVARLDDLHAAPMWVADAAMDSAWTARLVALGADENVRYVLVGFAAPAAQGITLTVRLYRTARGTQVWSRTYTGGLTELLGVESDISRAVGSVVGGRTESASRRNPAGRRPTTSAAAYLMYLRGDAELRDERRGAAASAMDEFSNAVALDSTFGVAWAGLATSAVERLRRGDIGGTPADDSALLGVATFAERHAVSLTPRSAETWLARAAVVEMQQPRDYAEAFSAYHRALDLSPWSVEAHRQFGRALLDVGATEEGLEQFRAALREAPGDPDTWVELANLHLMQRDYHGACHAADVAIASDPRHATAYAARAYVRLRLKDIRNAYADAETGTRLGAWLAGGVASVMAAADARDTLGARQRLTTLFAATPHAADRPTVWEAHYIAKAYATIAQNDRALVVLEHARPRGASLWWALHDPSFDRLRYAAAFGSLLSESAPAGAPALPPPAPPASDTSSSPAKDTTPLATSASDTSATARSSTATPAAVP